MGLKPLHELFAYDFIQNAFIAETLAAIQVFLLKIFDTGSPSRLQVSNIFSKNTLTQNSDEAQNGFKKKSKAQASFKINVKRL